ncbi:hypothetical protein ACWAUC_12255 [Bradyrhizobium guangdongense]
MSNSNMALPSCACGRSCLRLLSLAVVLTSLFILVAPRSHGQEIGRLYATRPPPGYAFIRVATLAEGAPPRVQINSQDMQLNEETAVSYYRAVPGNQPVTIAVNGSAVSKDIVPGAAAYLTLVIAKTSSDWTVQSIDEGQNSSDGLKAKLRFFNLAPGCTAALRIAEGPPIFEQAPFASVRSRTINPVTAKLEGSCNESGASLTLPQLRAGDYYSLFLRKEAERLRLTGQLDETEPYRER